MFVKKNLACLLKNGCFQSGIFLAALVIFFASTTPYFFSLSNFENILSASAVVGILALGQTFVIAGGGIDLSVASVMALSSTVCALFIQDSNASIFAALFVSCLTGALCGIISGVFINLTKAPSFIITLGMLSVVRAIAYILAEGTPVYGLPDHITGLEQGVMLVPGSMLFFLAAAVFCYFLLHFTRFGIHTLIFGDNPYSAKANGIPLGSLKIKIYALSGLLSGLAGFVFMVRTNCGDPTAGQNYELVAITAVILGGARLFGGSANILGTVIGISCLGILQNGLNLLAVSTYYQVLFVGLVLIGAAFFNRLSVSR